MGDLIPKPQIPVDPNLALEQQQADAANIRALSTQAGGDTASLMARYGSRLALAGSLNGGGNISSGATASLFGTAGYGTGISPTTGSVAAPLKGAG